MEPLLSPEDMIRANADRVLALARAEAGPGVGFDAAGVRWLNTYIQGMVDRGNVDASETLCDNLGSFLGLCIMQTYGGTWQDTEHGWAVVLDGDLAVFPFNKTLKHLTQGGGESVLRLYESIPALLGQASDLSSPRDPATYPEGASTVPERPAGKRSLLGRLFGRR